jgi:hypothetical protein
MMLGRRRERRRERKGEKRGEGGRRVKEASHYRRSGVSSFRGSPGHC